MIISELFFSLNFIFICVVFFNLRKRYKLNHLCDHMPGIVANLGYSIAILGKKGSGKTTSGAGICQYLTQYLLQEMTARMDEIRIKIKSVDFNYINTAVDNFIIMHNTDDEVYEEINNFVAFFENKENMLFDRFRSKQEFEFYYTDFLSIDEKKKLLKEYMEYYYIINYRKQFVLSRGYFYNVISEELGKLYDPSSLEIRNVLDKHNWQIDFANIVFDDETSIRDGSALSNDKQVKLSGSKDFDALIRNAGKGLIYKISIKQNSEDHIKANRKQIDANLDIFDRKEYSSFKLIRKLLGLLVSLSYLPVKIHYFVKSIFKKDFDAASALETYKNKNNKHRKFEYHIHQVQELLKRTGFIRVRYRNYYSSEDVGKLDDSLYERIILYFPIYYCYGTVKTHEFAFLIDNYKTMSENKIDSKTSRFDDEEKTKLFINDTLKRGD